MTDDLLKEAMFLLETYCQFTYIPDEDTGVIYKYDNDSQEFICSAGTYIEPTVMTDDEIISDLQAASSNRNDWQRRCRELLGKLPYRERRPLPCNQQTFS